MDFQSRVNYYRQKAKEAMDEKIDRFFDMCEDEMIDRNMAYWLVSVAFLFGIVGGLILEKLHHG